MLVVAGSFIMSDGTLAYVAAYAFSNATWTTVGTIGAAAGALPGPVTAMTVDDRNMDAIYVSGL